MLGPQPGWRQGFASITSLFFSWTGFKPRSVRVTGRASAPHREAGDDQGDGRHDQEHRDRVQAAGRRALLEDSAEQGLGEDGADVAASLELSARPWRTLRRRA